MRAVVILAALSLGAVGLVVASPAPAKCTELGTSGPDPLHGTPRKDVICGLQSGDYLSGAAQADRLFGDAGRDTLVGGNGADILKAGKSNDRLFGVDGEPDDILRGGRGNGDLCFGDPGDEMHGCERRFRGASIRLANSLSSAFNGGLELVELIPTIPPVTVTVPANCGGHPAPPPIC